MTSAAITHPSQRSYWSRSKTSQSPKPSVSSIPRPIAAAAITVRRRRRAISLGRSRSAADMPRTQATTTPPRNTNAPVTCRKSNQSYLLTDGENTFGGRDTEAPATPDRDDRSRQLDARSRGGARPRRTQGGGCARRRCLLRLPLRRARRRARVARDARDASRRDDEAPPPSARSGNHRRGGAGALAGDAAGRRTPRSALQVLPELACGSLPVDPRGADPGAREARGRAQRPHDRAARVHPRRDRPPARDRGAGGAVDPARAALRSRTTAGRRAGGTRAHLRGRVRLALPRGVARGDRAHDHGRARSHRRGARARRRRDRLARGPPRRLCRATAAPLARAADRRARLRPRRALL